jgi:hypothetical protein
MSQPKGSQILNRLALVTFCIMCTSSRPVFAQGFSICTFATLNFAENQWDRGNPSNGCIQYSAAVANATFNLYLVSPGTNGFTTFKGTAPKGLVIVVCDATAHLDKGITLTGP